MLLVIKIVVLKKKKTQHNLLTFVLVIHQIK